MQRTASHIATMAATFSLVTGGPAALMTESADATSMAYAKKCKTTSKEFPTSGFNTDVTIKLCVERAYSSVLGRGAHYAWVDSIRWTDGGGVRKFDKFRVRYRLERYNDTRSAKTCNWAKKINDKASGSGWCPDQGYSSSKATGGWTADGTVTYNLDADGKGDLTWSLSGTARVR